MDRRGTGAGVSSSDARRGERSLLRPTCRDRVGNIVRLRGFRRRTADAAGDLMRNRVLSTRHPAGALTAKNTAVKPAPAHPHAGPNHDKTRAAHARGGRRRPYFPVADRVASSTPVCPTSSPRTSGAGREGSRRHYSSTSSSSAVRTMARSNAGPLARGTPQQGYQSAFDAGQVYAPGSAYQQSIAARPTARLSSAARAAAGRGLKGLDAARSSSSRCVAVFLQHAAQQHDPGLLRRPCTEATR